MNSADRQELLKLYELAVNEEHHYLDAHQARISFYSGIVVAVLAATATGVFYVSTRPHIAPLCFSPVVAFGLSALAIRATRRFYRRALESITVRAKIEQELGLAEARQSEQDTSGSYWGSEPIVPQRHIESRLTHKSSQDFVNHFLTRGYQRWTEWLFRMFQGLSLLMLAAAIYWLLYW